jgi:hypothetical protein
MNQDPYQFGWNLAKALFEAGRAAGTADFARKKSARKPTPGRSYTRGAGKKQAKPPSKSSDLKTKKSCSKGTACGRSCISSNKVCGGQTLKNTVRAAAEYLKRGTTTSGKKLSKADQRRIQELSDDAQRQLDDRAKSQKPKPKKALDESGIPHNDFTRQWKQAWDEADIPPDLMRVLSKVPPVNQGEGEAAFDVFSRTISIDDFKPTTDAGRSAYRHEFGHYIDATLGGGARKSREREERIQANFDALAKMSPEQRKREWDAVAEKAIAHLATPAGRKEVEERVDRSIQRFRKRMREATESSERKRFKAKLENILKDKDAAIQETLDAIEKGFRDGNGLAQTPGTARLFEDRFGGVIKGQDLSDDAAQMIDRMKVTSSVVSSGQANVWKEMPMASDSREFAKALGQDSKDLLAERRRTASDRKKLGLDQSAPEAEVLAGLYAQSASSPAERSALARKAADIAAQNPGLAVVKQAIDALSASSPDPDNFRQQVYQHAFRPDGSPASREQIANVLDQVSRQAAANGQKLPFHSVVPAEMFDLMGATTDEQIGHGHSKGYYAAGKDSNHGVALQATEVFANLTELHAYNESTRALAGFLLPNQYREYQQILKNAQVDP